MMDERFLWIVRYLDEEGREVPVRELAERMDVSARTVRNILSQNTDQWNNGGFLLQRSLTGVSIRVKDKDRLRRFLSAGTSGGFDNTSRLNHMLWRLLQKGGYLRIEELAEEMNVSRGVPPQIRYPPGRNGGKQKNMLCAPRALPDPGG